MVYTVKFCQGRLDMWLSAEEALATSQSYKMGSRQLTRADLSTVRKSITYWENELEKAKNGGRRRKMFKVVPRDL